MRWQDPTSDFEPRNARDRRDAGGGGQVSSTTGRRLWGQSSVTNPRSRILVRPVTVAPDPPLGEGAPARAAEVDLLLPEAADRDGLSEPRLLSSSAPGR